MTAHLETLPEDFDRAMAVVAHPDDLEYGAASAVARWTSSGAAVGYVIATDGKAGIDGLDPAEAGPLRQKEQVTSAAVVGVGDVTFLGHSPVGRCCSPAPTPTSRSSVGCPPGCSRHCSLC